LVLLQTMMLYVFLVVLAGQTCIHTTKEYLPFDLLDVCSLGTGHIAKELNVLILPLVEFTSPEMLSLMRVFFPLPL
jgi:hypothetical protein